MTLRARLLGAGIGFVLAISGAVALFVVPDNSEIAILGGYYSGFASGLGVAMVLCFAFMPGGGTEP